MGLFLIFYISSVIITQLHKLLHRILNYLFLGLKFKILGAKISSKWTIMTFLVSTKFYFSPETRGWKRPVVHSTLSMNRRLFLVRIPYHSYWVLHFNYSISCLNSRYLVTRLLVLIRVSWVVKDGSLFLINDCIQVDWTS